MSFAREESWFHLFVCWINGYLNFNNFNLRKLLFLIILNIASNVQRDIEVLLHDVEAGSLLFVLITQTGISATCNWTKCDSKIADGKVLV